LQRAERADVGDRAGREPDLARGGAGAVGESLIVTRKRPLSPPSSRRRPGPISPTSTGGSLPSGRVQRPQTNKLYDRAGDEIKLNEIGRITI